MGSLLSLLLYVDTAYSYFEHKYFCVIQGQAISVSIQTGEKLCFDYLASMEEEITQLDTQITRAKGYLTVGSIDDQQYRSGVVNTLMQRRAEWLSLRERFIVAIDDYERDLFLRVKGLVTFYLKPEREQLFEKIQQANTLLLRLKLIGDTERYQFVLQNLEQLQRMVSFLDHIKFSQNFGELIPPLKEYLEQPRVRTDDIT